MAPLINLTTLNVSQHSGIKNDDFVKSFPQWQNALVQMADSKVRAEQQSLAKYGLKYVVEEYLPAKVEDSSTWLP
ncbi:hypothetical protein [Methanococcus maripaludis]|uniref:hypothetical protein n=1 Tax=Methanococcus maripaludis TaxID=39152 RepID=UPI003C6D66B1